MASPESDDTDLARPESGGGAQPPSVLIILVVRNGAQWLPETLASIAGQTYTRTGVVAVDNASTDGSADLLTASLGEARVIRQAEDLGLAGAVGAVLGLDVAQEADYSLILHDDAALAPDAVERLVEAAVGIEDVEGVGIVGAKIVDWQDPRVLRDVGSAADRFGHPYSPLEPHEVDHGQHDRVREVLFVSSATMLVARSVWLRSGLPDERLGSSANALDYCWRARVAGFRVLWTPLARVRHVGAGSSNERIGERRSAHKRYAEERTALAAILKNYRLLTLIWLLPLFLLQGIAKVIGLTLTRRFEDVGQLLAAWGWNIAHLPGTIGRRFKIQRARRVQDHDVHRYMAPGSIRARRWLDAFGRVLPGDIDVPDDDDDAGSVVPLRTMASSAIRAHPVATAWLIGAVVAFFSYRYLISTSPLTGGVVPAMPDSASTVWQELIAGVRTTGLGGAQSASPALAVFGGLSTALFGHTDLAERVLLMVLPLLAAVSMYGLLARITQRVVPSLMGAGLYAVSALGLWTFSQGRIGFLAAYAVFPRLADRIGIALGERPPGARTRFVVGTAVFLAFAVAFWPGVLLGCAVFFVVWFLLPEERRRRRGGVPLLLFVLAVAGLLLLPFAIDLVADLGSGLGSRVGIPDLEATIRLVLGPGKGSGAIAWLLPAAAILGFIVVAKHLRRAALRFMVAALAGLALTWASVAGFLPAQLANAPAYAGVVAVSYCGLAALGVASVLGRTRSDARGPRKLAAGLLMTAVIVGLVLQGGLAAVGTWEIGNRSLPPAYPIVGRTEGAFRVLWLSGERGAPFPAPGGDPLGVAAQGESTVWYSVTDVHGTSALDTGRWQAGDGFDVLGSDLAQLQTGTTRHLGALLSPLGIRFIVAGTGDLPESVREQLLRQVDIARVPALGLEIFEIPSAIPEAAVADEAFSGDGSTDDAATIATLGSVEVRPLAANGIGWDGESAEGGRIWVGQQYAPGWEMSGPSGSEPLERSLGWAMGVAAPASGSFSIRYTDQWIRTLETLVLVIAWAVALWITRKPLGSNR